MTGDCSAEELALQQQLQREPRNLTVLAKLGDLKARSGDDRAATSFFQAAMNVAAITRDIPASLHPLLNRAQAFLAAANQRFEDHLVNSLRSSGAKGGARIDAALDLLVGKRELYLQQPSSFYFPGLPQRQFYERAEFPWIAEIEAMIPAMRDELNAILADCATFDPYVVSDPNRPLSNNPLRDDPSWGAFYFWQHGKRIEANAARAPVTMCALEAAPIPIIDQRSPMALYSLLKPGTHIQPHHGLLNTRLICHIPLIAPEGCTLRVGNETRPWTEGEALIFDDSIEHEAWNRSDRTRIILLFEVWRPELKADERAALTALFEAINDYAGVPEDRG